MTCTSDIIFHNENVGTDGNPIIQAQVSCDSNTGCGFSVPYFDDTGTKHDAYDFWVTSSDFHRYESIHRRYADTHQELPPHV